MRAVLPGRPESKLQALSTALWDGLRIVVRHDTSFLDINRLHAD